MKNSTTQERGLVPRRIKGFRDIDDAGNRLRWHIIQHASQVYARYGFEHWDTPVLEYADALGKYLPDADTTQEGVYSFRNPEREPVLDTRGEPLRDDWNNVQMENAYLALRYDLTAPLARLYAERLWELKRRNPQLSAKKVPLFRRYQFGPVYRFEARLDPGRFREFWQLDFDTVGTVDPACDAEVCFVLCDALEAVGLERGSYQVRVNDRKLHRGLFEQLDVAGNEDLERDILRIVDKYDKIGAEGVAAELTGGRTDPGSGARIPGLGLEDSVVERVLAFMEGCAGVSDRSEVIRRLQDLVGNTPSGQEGIDELTAIHELCDGLGYQADRVVFDPSVARGLAYYTGPVFEVVSTLEYRDQKGRIREFGSICGGGRYDGLVERLLGMRVPATGASIGVDRLAELLQRVREGEIADGPVLVVMLDRSRKLEYQRIAAELRGAGIPTEVYYGRQRRMGAQLSHADAQGSPVAIIAGGDEFDRGTVSVKDLKLGKKLSQEIESREQWRRAQPAQVEVAREEMVSRVRAILDRDSAAGAS